MTFQAKPDDDPPEQPPAARKEHLTPDDPEQRKEHLTPDDDNNVEPMLTEADRARFDSVVRVGQDAWAKHQLGTLYTLHAQVPTLRLAQTEPAKWALYVAACGLPGDFIEHQVAELMVRRDWDYAGEMPDAFLNTYTEDARPDMRSRLTRERRREYGGCIAWFACPALCPTDDPDQAVQLAKENGRIAGTAAAYRQRVKALTEALEAEVAAKIAEAQAAGVLSEDDEELSEEEQYEEDKALFNNGSLELPFDHDEEDYARQSAKLADAMLRLIEYGDAEGYDAPDASPQPDERVVNWIQVWAADGKSCVWLRCINLGDVHYTARSLF